MRIVQLIWLNKERDFNFVDVETIPVSFFRDRIFLEKSIAENGIFTPILVRHIPTGWQIISGQGRWNACKQNVPALEIECDEETAFLIHVQENLERGFNTIEIARIMDRFHNKLGWSFSKIGMVLSPLLDIPNSSKVLQDYLTLLRLPSLVQSIIAEDSLPLKVSVIFSDFSSEDAIELSQLGRKMRWNANKLREILTWLWEICKRENITVRTILQLPELQTENPQQYGEELRKYIFARKNPSLYQAQEEFNQVIGKIAWSSPVMIQPSPNFEQNQITFQFSIGNLENFQKIVAQLHSMEEIVATLLTIGR